MLKCFPCSDFNQSNRAKIALYEFHYIARIWFWVVLKCKWLKEGDAAQRGELHNEIFAPLILIVNHALFSFIDKLNNVEILTNWLVPLKAHLNFPVFNLILSTFIPLGAQFCAVENLSNWNWLFPLPLCKTKD